MDQNLRTNIKKTAAKLFLKYGLRSVSIDDICNELHISKKTFYTQFSQKEALIESVLMEHNEKHLRKQENKYNPCQCEGNAIDHLMKVSEFHSSTKNDKFVNFFYDLKKYYPEIHKRITQLNQKKICEFIRQNILTGIQENLFRSDIDIESMTTFLSVQFKTVMNLNTDKISRTSMLRSIELVMDVYVRVLCNRKGLDYYENLLSQKAKQMKTEDGPLKDEELDRILDQVMNTSE